MKKIKASLLVLTALIGMLQTPVFATQNVGIGLPQNTIQVDESETGSIEIELTDGGIGTSKKGVVFEYVKVAEINDGSYHLLSQYSDSKIDLNKIEYAEEMDQAAKKLSYYKTSDGSITTNSSGRAKVSNLGVGVYLLYVSDQSSYDDITPILIAIPTWDEEVGDMIYDVSVYPKHTPVSPGKVTTSTPHTSTNAAKTGDIQNFGIWIAAAGCSIVIGITIYCIKRKKKHE